MWLSRSSKVNLHSSLMAYTAGAYPGWSDNPLLSPPPQKKKIKSYLRSVSRVFLLLPWKIQNEKTCSVFWGANSSRHSFRYKTQVPMANLHLATRRRCNRADSIQTIWNFPPIFFFALWHARVYIRDFSPPCASPGYYQLFPWRPCNSQVWLTCKSRP